MIRLIDTHRHEYSDRWIEESVLNVGKLFIFFVMSLGISPGQGISFCLFFKEKKRRDEGSRRLFYQSFKQFDVHKEAQGTLRQAACRPGEGLSLSKIVMASGSLPFSRCLASLGVPGS